MAEHVDFWKGLVAGTLVGMVVAAYAQGDFKPLLSFECSLANPLPFEPEVSFRAHSEGLNLRREASESAGDPTRLSPDLASAPGCNPCRSSVLAERPAVLPPTRSLKSPDIPAS